MGMASGIVVLVYLVLVIAIAGYLIALATRFVKAHERGSSALEAIAQKLNSGGH